MRILLLLLLLPGMLKAQDRIADSLHVELGRASCDSARVAINCELSRHFSLKDAKLARTHAYTADSLAAATGSDRGRIKALLLLGNANVSMGEYEKSLEHYFESMRLSKQLQDTTNLISSYLKLGIVYKKAMDLERATTFYEHAIKLAASSKDSLHLSSAYNNLGDALEAQQDYAGAMRYYKKAVVIQEAIGNKKGLAISLLNIGYLHLLQGRPAGGLPYLFRSVELNKEMGNNLILMTTYGRISELYLAMDQKEKALEYATLGYNMAIVTESSKKIAEASKNMHLAYAAMQDYPRAYEYISIYNKHNDILQADNRKKIETELMVKYETEHMEAENKLLKATQEHQEEQIKVQRFLLFIGILALLLLLGLLFELYRSRLRQKAAYSCLEEAHKLMQQQQSEISAQSAKLRTQNEHLEKQRDFQRKVFSIISHDLRGPFSSVKSVLGLAMRKSMSEADTSRIFTLLSRDMDVANSMLDNVLIWAKAQMEDSYVEMQALGIKAITDDTIAQVKPHADKKEVELLNLTSDSAYVHADKERLRFVLRNLLMNAIKFSKPGDQVLVLTTVEEDSLLLTVKDSGNGISAANVAKLFTDTRYTTLGTSGEKGTGLGLMLCKELLESFGGRIWVESAEGQGSTFFVKLPCAIPAAGILHAQINTLQEV